VEDSPFAVRLTKLLEREDISQRELARRLARHGVGPTRHGTLSGYLHGRIQPSMEAMEAIAAVFNISPYHFTEYKLEEIRDGLDWRQHGLEQALQFLGDGEPALKRAGPA